MRAAAAVMVVALLASGTLGCASSGPDPWEGFNRGIFAFNETADQYVIEPVAKGWDFVVPEFAQTAVENVFENSKAPIQIGNNFLQGEFEEGYLQIWRFLLNSSFGLGGLIDVADLAGWPDHPEDFGLTLGTWGVPHGPYVVLPIFGASSVRDTVGLGVDSMSSIYSYFVPVYVPIAARAGELLNRRAIFLEEIAQSREEAFDFYVFVRNAYLQNREHRLTGVTAVAPASEPDEDLYYFDEYDEEYDDADE